MVELIVAQIRFDYLVRTGYIGFINGRWQYADKSVKEQYGIDHVVIVGTESLEVPIWEVRWMSEQLKLHDEIKLNNHLNRGLTALPEIVRYLQAVSNKTTISDLYL